MVIGAGSASALLSAATPITATVTTITGGAAAGGDSFVTGASGVISIASAGNAFIDDGGNVTVTSNAPGVTFSGAAETTTSAATVNFSSTAATVPGTYSLTIKDNGGTSATLTAGFVVNAAPTITSVSANILAKGQSVAGWTVTGTGFDNTINNDANTNHVISAVLVSEVNGTLIEVGNVAGATDGLPLTGTNVTSSSVQYNIVATNASGTTALGAYDLILTNSDGGSVTYTNALTVTAGGVTNVSPSDVVTPATGARTSVATAEISGAGFQQGATVTLGTTFTVKTAAVAAPGFVSDALVGPVDTFTAASFASAPAKDWVCEDATQGIFGVVTNGSTPSKTNVECTFDSNPTAGVPGNLPVGDVIIIAKAIFAPATYTPTLITGDLEAGAVAGALGVTVTNPNTGGGNGAVFTTANAFGIGTVASPAPTITSVTAGSLTPGQLTAVTVVINGFGFDPRAGATANFFYSAAGVSTADATIDAATTCSVNQTGVPGTTVTCSIATVGNGAFAGVDGIKVKNVGGSFQTSATAAALTVAGPAITALSPTSIAAGSPVGTTVTITGSGFNNTASAALTGGNLTGAVLQIISPTSATLALIAKPTATTSGTLTISDYNANGVSVNSAPALITVNAAPTVAFSSNAGWFLKTGNPHGTGAGSTNAAVLIVGSGIQSGAKIGSFTDVSGNPDTKVSGTFVSVDVTKAKAVFALTIAASDTSISDGYTITNPDGGTVTVAPFSAGAITIDNAPVITSITPTKGTGGGATTFTVTGSNFDTTQPSFPSTQLIVYPLGTGLCGATTIVSSTTLTATCALANAGSAPVSIAVANYDGGLAVSAPVLAAVVPAVAPTNIPAFNVAFAKGSAVLSAAAKAALATFVSSVTDGSSVTITAWGTTGALATARVAAIAFYISNASSSIGLHYTLAHGVNKTLNKGVVTETVAK